MPAEAVVLDANLLVLFIVGTVSPSLIPRHKRLPAYTEMTIGCSDLDLRQLLL